ncbi:MAG: 4-oxalocrotonate tautomerase [Vampirovibrionales bacterium]
MPLITVELLPGRSVEQKRAYVAEVTRLTCDILKCPPEAVRVRLSEMQPEDYAIGGVLYVDKQAPPSV